CAEGSRSRPARSRATASGAAPIAETGVQLDGQTGSGFPSRFFYFFSGDGGRGMQVDSSAFRAEHREGMKIERGAQVRGGARAFEWNLVAGTARVEPPAPFSGRAFYRIGPGGRSSWTGSLQAPVLGGAPIQLTG